MTDATENLRAEVRRFARHTTDCDRFKRGILFTTPEECTCYVRRTDAALERLEAAERVITEARSLCKNTQLEPPFENEETAELVLALQRFDGAALAREEKPDGVAR